MASGRSFYDYTKFVRKFAQFKKLWFLSENLLLDDSTISDKSMNRLIVLNRRRQQIQENLSKLNSAFFDICSGCGGLCCILGSDHFSVTDYWLRRYSDNPIKSFRRENQSQSNFRLHSARIRRLLLSNDDLLSIKNPTSCRFSSQNGCKLDGCDSPIRCFAMTCIKIRKAMDKDMKKQHANLTNQLYLISREVFAILKIESGGSLSYGNLQLIFTL